jgi:hypothetical protein
MLGNRSRESFFPATFFNGFMWSNDMNKFGSEYEDDYEVQVFNMVKHGEGDDSHLCAFGSYDEHDLDTPIVCIDVLVQKNDDNDRDPIIELSVMCSDVDNAEELANNVASIFEEYFNPQVEDKRNYEVVIGNIGTTLITNDEKAAIAEYDLCVAWSKQGHGRAGYEDVTLMCDGEISQEHTDSREVTDGEW